MAKGYLILAITLFIGAAFFVVRSETLGAVAFFVVGSLVLNKALRGKWFVS